MSTTDWEVGHCLCVTHRSNLHRLPSSENVEGLWSARSHVRTPSCITIGSSGATRMIFKLLGFINTNIQKVVDDEAKGKFSFDGEGPSHSSLSICNITLSDGGIYFCAPSRYSAAPLNQHVG